MGEEKKEEKKEEEAQEIVLKIDMHCEGCARKVARALKGFQGVEGVTADYKASKVVVKGKNANPIKVCERVKKKSGRKVELISPLPNSPEESTKEEIKKEEEPKEEKKDEPPPVTAVVLNVQMHCDGCAQVLQKRIHKIKGVESVTTDLGKNQVIVKGVIDPEKLVTDVYKGTGKQVSVVKNNIEEKKEEEKKKEEEEKDSSTKEEEEKKEGAEEGKGEDIKRSEYLPQMYYYNSNMEYANYSPQIFSDENPHACSLM